MSDFWDGSHQPCPDDDDDRDARDPFGTSYFIDNLKETFKQGEDCDLTITCGARRWQVHKLILCLHSKVFKKMLRGPFKVSKHGGEPSPCTLITIWSQEGSQAEVALDNDDPDVLDNIFDYMYTFECGHFMTTHARRWKLVMCMRVAKAADFYSMPHLGAAARGAFNGYLSIRYSILRLSSFEFDPDVVDAISEAFREDGYDQFRRPLLGIAAQNLEELKAQPEKYNYFWNVVDSCAPFAVALLRYRPGKVSRADQAHTEPRSDKKGKFKSASKKRGISLMDIEN